jgi:hypothetical protein
MAIPIQNRLRKEQKYLMFSGSISDRKCSLFWLSPDHIKEDSSAREKVADHVAKKVWQNCLPL